jgi:hypothetical protein
VSRWYSRSLEQSQLFGTGERPHPGAGWLSRQCGDLSVPNGGDVSNGLQGGSSSGRHVDHLAQADSYSATQEGSVAKGE